MIKPSQITDYNRGTEALQEFLLFAVVVAGKNSMIQATKLDNFLLLLTNSYTAHNHVRPLDYFDAIRWAEPIGVAKWLKVARMGQYTRITKAFCSIAEAEPNLKIVTAAELAKIEGIGPKTSRFFVLHTQKNARCAALDTHILKHMKAEHPDEYVRSIVPKSTPSGNLYNVLEQKFLEMVDKTDMTVAEYDLKVWNSYSK